MIEWIAAIGLAAVVFIILWFVWPQPAARLFMAVDRRFGGLRSRRTQCEGINWHYLEGGRGEPLVLLHGFNANAYHFTRVARYLNHRFRILAPDLPGFGQTIALEQFDYTIDAQAERLHRWLDHLGIEECYIGGNSMGGYAAAALARRLPGRVHALWLLAPGGLHTAPYSPLFQAIKRGEHNQLLVRNMDDFNRLTDLCFFHKPSIPHPLRLWLARRAAMNVERAGRIFEAMRFHSTPLEETAPTLDVPALIVWGEQDHVLHPGGMDLLDQQMPNSQTQLLPETGHLPMLERPREVAEAWLGYVESLAPCDN